MSDPTEETIERFECDDASELARLLNVALQLAERHSGEDAPVLYVEAPDGMVVGFKLVERTLTDGSKSLDIVLELS